MKARNLLRVEYVFIVVKKAHNNKTFFLKNFIQINSLNTFPKFTKNKLSILILKLFAFNDFLIVSANVLELGKFP